MTEIMSLRIDDKVKADFLFLAEKTDRTQSSLFALMIKKYCRLAIIEIQQSVDVFHIKDNDLNIAMGKDFINQEIDKLQVELEYNCKILDITPWILKRL
jgi:antitoxin component of RelBE/YafQ-DinJ toxin-antitoxin module